MVIKRPASSSLLIGHEKLNPYGFLAAGKLHPSLAVIYLVTINYSYYLYVLVKNTRLVRRIAKNIQKYADVLYESPYTKDPVY